MGLGHGLELIPCEGCESLALLPLIQILGSVTLPSLRRPPYGRVSERVILQNDTESESESESDSFGWACDGRVQKRFPPSELN